jgi:hypothetical protein
MTDNIIPMKPTTTATITVELRTETVKLLENFVALNQGSRDSHGFRTGTVVGKGSTARAAAAGGGVGQSLEITNTA